MCLARSFGLLLMGFGLSSLGCDRIEALKDQLVSSSKPEVGESPELAAIRSLYQGGKYDEALQTIGAAVQKYPGMAEAFYFKGLCHLARAGGADLKAPLSEEEVLGLEAFERALSINPRHALSSIGIGDLYSRRVPARRRRAGASEDPQDPYVLAISAYEKAVTIDPKLPEAQQRYALFLERTGQLDQAETAYKAAVEAAAVVPEIAPDYYLAYGRFLAGPRDRLTEALEQFELALVFRQGDVAIEQEIAIVHSRVGLRHLERQEYLMAEQALKQAQALFPDASIPEAQKTTAALEELRSIRRR
ncbi:MAG: tetratricopeptide repeat protein [Vicinamibacteria bacterium]